MTTESARIPYQLPTHHPCDHLLTHRAFSRFSDGSQPQIPSILSADFAEQRRLEDLFQAAVHSPAPQIC